MARNCLPLSIVLVMIFALSACGTGREADEISDRLTRDLEAEGIVLEGGIIPDPGLELVIGKS